MKHVVLSTLFLLAASSLNSEISFAAPKPPAGSTSKLPAKLPAKKTATKRTVIDMSEAAGVVIAPKNPALNKAIKKSEAEVRVQSRIFVPAPPGDLSELPSKLEIPVAKKSISPRQTPAAVPPPPPLAVAPVAVAPTVVAESNSIIHPVILPPVPIEPMKEFSQSKETIEPEQTAPADLPVVLETSSETSPAMAVNINKRTERHSHFPAPQTLAFLRTGYLQANYKKFDERMKNGSTYVGFGVAREFETDWGAFEARASLDAYHAMDQSITVDNVRMLATRTEVGYWFSRSRVRPGISLGLGWTDYSVRSYRAISSANDPSNQTVVLKTHAKSQAFTVIPGTSLRIEVAEGLVIDTQTEFLAILGGDSADAVQGLSFGIGLGWLF